jgi:hypothetical protein
MRQTADAMGRPVVLFAVMIVLCCLPGCGVITGALGTFDEDEDSPVPRNLYDDDDPDKPSSSLQMYSPNAFFNSPESPVIRKDLAISCPGVQNAPDNFDGLFSGARAT